jgi:hypothetical protein
MANFKQSERSQGLFLTVNLEDQLIPGTFEWTIDYLIKVLPKTKAILKAGSKKLQFLNNSN